MGDELTERDYNTLISAMDDIKNELKSGFSDSKEESKKTNQKIDLINKEVVLIKLNQKDFVTMKQLVTFTAWLIATILTITAIVIAFLSLIKQ